MWASGQPAQAPAPPADQELRTRIETFAQYVQQNGPSFAQMMAERQAANPEFAFLRGGEGAVYYSWLLQQSGATGAVTAPAAAAAPAVAAAPAPQQQQQQAAPHQAPSAAAPTPEGAAALAAMPAEVSSGWGQVLGLLSGSRDSIRNSQQWFMACAPFAAGMAEMLLQHALRLADHERQLHALYLANDILFRALAMRAPGSGPDADAIAVAFRPRLGRLLRAAYVSGGAGAEAQGALLRVVHFWGERGVYSQLAVEEFTMEMLGVSGSAGPAAAGAVGAGAAAAQPAAQAQPGAAAAGGSKWDAAPAQAAAGGHSKWDSAPAGAAAGAVPAAAAAPGQWGQQQAMAVQQAYAGAHGAPPPSSSYYAPGQDPQQLAAQQQQQQQQHWQQQQQGPGGAHIDPYSYPPPPGGVPGAYPPPGQQYHGQPAYPGHQQQQQYPGAHPQHPQAHYAPPPGGQAPFYPPPSGGIERAPFYPPPPAPEPEPEPFDPMSFPPGLIPRLVQDKLRTDPPYSPLSILDIERSGVPPAPEMDAYLKSRLDRLAAQLADYRPGMLFSDIELDAPRARAFSDRDRGGHGPMGGPPLPPAGPELPHAGLGLGPNMGQLFMGLGGPAPTPADDGSYQGGAGGGGFRGSGKGLGFARPGAPPGSGAPGADPASGGVPGEEPAGGDDTVFSSYRRMRSSGYHHMIINNSAGKKFHTKH